ncbi:MAG: hypothetical protein AB7O59_08835 [Pirellulales bacterium]
MGHQFSIRRWFQFSLRTFLLAVAAVGCWLGWNLHVVKQREAARAAFVAEGWELSESDDLHVPWIRRLLGDKAFYSIHVGFPPSRSLVEARAWLPEAEVWEGDSCLVHVDAEHESYYLEFNPERRALYTAAGLRPVAHPAEPASSAFGDPGVLSR